MNEADLIAFEKEIAADFEAGLIAAPVHLAGGNEAELIRIFNQINQKDDYICCQWRSHYHCLLKGVPKDKLKRAIHDGRSIALCFPEHKIISSAIVGGIAPIAVGLAWAIKQRKGKEKVWCFLGDMTSRTGIVHESIHYAHGHSLPIIFVLEDNEKSVCTPTGDVWGNHWNPNADWCDVEYEYQLTWPHVSTGKWVSF